MPNRSLKISSMTSRIYAREDNLYSKEVISNVLKMYMEECRKSLLKGERVQLAGVGTIIPEVRTHRNCFLPTCNNEDHENAPYTRLKISRTQALTEGMNQALCENIENGILGLGEELFDERQIANLRKGGFIPDAEAECEGEV